MSGSAQDGSGTRLPHAGGLAPAPCAQKREDASFRLVCIFGIVRSTGKEGKKAVNETLRRE